jgi:hypothetical protein
MSGPLLAADILPKKKNSFFPRASFGRTNFEEPSAIGSDVSH